MQKRKEKGYCTGCEFWGTDEAALAQLEKVWGKSDEKFIKENSSCQLSASDWNSLCPHANDPD